MKRLYKLLLALSIITFVLSCVKVPMTGRKQMKLVSSSSMQSISRDTYKQFLDTNKVVRSGAYHNYVKSTGKNISAAVMDYMDKNKKYKKRVEGYSWEFNLVESDVVNAWCMPGGKVSFYTGIMSTCESETGTAVVMGHEIAHAIAAHGNERMSQGLTAQVGGLALAVALSQKPKETQDVFLGAYGVGTQLGVMLPFSRLHESEADEMGLMFMAMAGYDPREAIKFWERMDELSKGQAPPEFLSTHPSHDTRIENIKKWMPKALTYYNAAKVKH